MVVKTLAAPTVTTMARGSCIGSLLSELLVLQAMLKTRGGLLHKIHMAGLFAHEISDGYVYRLRLSGLGKSKRLLFVGPMSMELSTGNY